MNNFVELIISFSSSYFEKSPKMPKNALFKDIQD